MKSDLTNLFVSAGLGPIGIGDNRQSVVKCLGVSTSVSTADSTIEKYGSLQLQYAGEILTKIALVFIGDRVVVPDKLHVDVSDLSRNTSVYGFLDWCERGGLEWKICTRLTFDRQLSVQVSEQGIALFDLDQRELQQIFVCDLSNA